MTRATANEQRLPRLLALVPYLQAHPGIAVAEAAADFGVTEQQLRRDLQLLWMCGLPGHGPGDLIDLSFEGETVSVIFDAGMSRPLRLTAEEALALVVALRTLAETPGLADSDAVQRALAKVETAAGGAVDGGTVTVALDSRRAAAAGAAPRRRRDRGRCRCATTPPPATRPPSASSTRCGCSRPTATPTSRPGAAAPRACGCSASTASRTSTCSTSRPARRDGLELRDLAEGVYQPASEHLLVGAAARPGLRLGRRLLPARGGQRAPTAACSVEPAGGRPGLGAGARPGLGRAGRGALAGLAGRVDPRRGRRARWPPTTAT